MTMYETTHRRTGALHYEGPSTRHGQIIIDAAELAPNDFEIMAFCEVSRHEIETRTARTLDDAGRIYNEMVKHYTTLPNDPTPLPPLSGKYAKLRDDLRTALEAGAQVERANPEDGGTCNFDSSALLLPRWNAARVKQAAREAGTSCWEWRLFGVKHFVFGPTTHSQGNARSRNAEAMTKCLRRLGYDATDYCQMD